MVKIGWSRRVKGVGHKLMHHPEVRRQAVVSSTLNVQRDQIQSKVSRLGPETITQRVDLDYSYIYRNTTTPPRKTP